MGQGRRTGIWTGYARGAWVGQAASAQHSDPDGRRLGRLWGVRVRVGVCGPVQGEQGGGVIPCVEHIVDAGLCEIAYL